MDESYCILGLLILIGVTLGSFVNALVWRLHVGEKGAKGKKQTRNLSILNGRSMCVHCKHQLAWNDLIPVVSWLALGGKCRYCKKSIFWQYPVVELMFSVLSVFSLVYWPYALNNAISWTVFSLWIMLLVPFVALVIYDIRWMIMPTSLIYVSGILAALFVVSLSTASHSWRPVTDGLIGVASLGGFFWLLYQVSGGKWIGGGDVRYAFVMGGLLGWQKALFGLALSSYLGTVLIIVLVLLRKYHKKMRLPFGPFLITATYLSLLFGQYAIDWYKSLAGF